MTSVRKEWSSEPLRVTVVARAALASQFELKDIAARELLRKNRLLYDACVRPPRPRANARPASLARPSISLVRKLRLSRANARQLAVPRPDSRRHLAPRDRPPRPATESEFPSSGFCRARSPARFRESLGVGLFRYLSPSVQRKRRDGDGERRGVCHQPVVWTTARALSRSRSVTYRLVPLMLPSAKVPSDPRRARGHHRAPGWRWRRRRRDHAAAAARGIT